MAILALLLHPLMATRPFHQHPERLQVLEDFPDTRVIVMGLLPAHEELSDFVTAGTIASGTVSLR